MKIVGGIIPLAVADGRAAVEYVRSHAAEYGIKPDQIGIIGFSAGGGVVGGVVYDHTPASRPDFAVPVYSALQRDDSQPVPADAMPLFVVCSADDVFGFQTQSADIFKKWNAAGSPPSCIFMKKAATASGPESKACPATNGWTPSGFGWIVTAG
ncbi:MAG: alpha/beta hydrolase fold domain-containing protein [Saprospiraceae bacterium]|nr:alpha/beta hydrolase fold domain-containing protein [Saprospiraceae bacterium]